VLGITHAGKTQNVAQWAEELGISREGMRLRVNRCLALGLVVSKALIRGLQSGTAIQ
jgi:hypothetical protein